MYRERYWNDRNLEAVEQLRNISLKYKHAPTDISIAWLLSHKSITSILSLVDFPEQLEQNVTAMEVTLSKEEIDECNTLYDSMLPAGWLTQELGVRPTK
jgi:aryl-alcohol dehydrogenase-like predicted oxidoreductase